MNVEMPLEADAQFAKAGKPRMGALDDSAILSRSLSVTCPAKGDACRYAVWLQMVLAAGEDIALVRMQFAWTFKQRLYVMPSPHPSSCGSSSRGILVRRIRGTMARLRAPFM